MMKHIFLVISLIFYSAHNVAFAAGCTAAKTDAEQKCSDQEYEKIKAEQAAIQQKIDQCKGKCTNEVMNVFLTSQNAALQKGLAYKEACSQSVNQCDSQCSAEAASPDPSTSQNGQQGKQVCEGEPRENEQASDQNNAAMMQALAGMLAAMMARGSEPPAGAISNLCGTASTAAAGGSTSAAATAATSPSVAALCNPDKTTVSDSSFADGTARTSGGNGEYDGAGNILGSNGPAAGTPAQVQLSNAMPGNAAGGGMGAGAAGAGSGSRDAGKKPEAEPSKMNFASTAGGGGGGGGGGSMAGGAGRSGAGGPSVAPSRTAVDTPDNRMQAALEKAAQLRGIASDGPMGGVTGANSLDNFQKIEKRMQSERNNLSER